MWLESIFKYSKMKLVNKQDILKFRISTQWAMRDFLEKIKPAPQSIRCPICGHKDANQSFKKFISRCVFGGGKLIRHECPSCGLIFGPQKFMTLSDNQISKEYRELYSYYDEADPSGLEERAFMRLRLNKEGIYLNYGSGKNINSIKKIRDQGYKLYGFEPFSEFRMTEDYIITDIDRLKLMRFDGIFTNNVIEHFIDPIKEMLFLSGILKDGGMMAHSTACYEYAFEHTRFHVFFFTGKSLSVLCEKAGLKYFDTDDKMIKIFVKGNSNA